MRNKTSLAEAMSKTKSKDLNKIGVEKNTVAKKMYV